MDETAGSTAAAPAARCRKILRGSFIGVLLPDRLYCTRVNGRGPAMRAWIDRTNDGLSGMPADGISLPLKRGTSARPAGPGSKVRLHQPRDWAEGCMAALGAPVRHHDAIRLSQRTEFDRSTDRDARPMSASPPSRRI